MTPDRFYELIDDARGGSSPSSPGAAPEALRGVLEPLTDDEIGGFLVAYEGELVRLNRWALWGAGYVLQGGMSDDGFHYFRSWLIGKGREAVETALAAPDDLAEFVDDSDLENEELEYVGLEILEERGVDEPDGLEGRSDDEPAGEPFDEDAVESMYPKLAAAAQRLDR